MEYLPQFSDSEIEADADNERNKVASGLDNRLDKYRRVVAPEEMDALLKELQGQ